MVPIFKIKNKNMKSLSRILIVVFFLLTSVSVYSQTHDQQIDDIVISDFSPVLSFLSSDWMEGREAGARDGFMAADYISSMMEHNGLKPYGDPLPVKESASGKENNPARSYFQDFDIIKYKIDKASLSWINQTGASAISFQLNHSIDFEVEAVPNGLEGEAPLVFAGYGISAPDKGYDDYKNLDVKGKIVVVLKGYPGHHDTASMAWKKLGKAFGKEYSGTDRKLKTALNRGAIALIEVSPNGSFNPYKNSQINLSIAQSVMNSEKQTDPVYMDDYYALPGDTSNITIPLFRLGSMATEKLFKGTGLNLKNVEDKAAKNLLTSAMAIKEKIAGFSLAVKVEALKVRNVLGIIPGKDTTKSVIVGAHYDHLGSRNALIYNGADDNASGVAGMLSIAKVWSMFSQKPACNIIFAAWTAEEKGLLGSSYFVQHTKADTNILRLIVNLDMISRSSAEDSAHLQLSIGTLRGNEAFKTIAQNNNLLLSHPFELDLWEASASGGSDYAPFASRNIPIMTFFSGLHDDYHSPRDTYDRADLSKMKSVLWLVNKCLKDVVENLKD
jgi:hypothetical protein